MAVVALPIQIAMKKRYLHTELPTLCTHCFPQVRSGIAVANALFIHSFSKERMRNGGFFPSDHSLVAGPTRMLLVAQKTTLEIWTGVTPVGCPICLLAGLSRILDLHSYTLRASERLMIRGGQMALGRKIVTVGGHA